METTHWCFFDVIFGSPFFKTICLKTIFIATFSVSIILWLLHKFSNICKSGEGWYGRPKSCYKKKTIHVVTGISFAVVFGLLVFGDWVHLRLRSIRQSEFRFWNPESQGKSSLGTRLKSVHRVDFNQEIQIRISWISWLLLFTVRLGKSEKGFTKLFSCIAVFFLLIMRVCSRPFLVSWQFFKSFFGFLNRTVERKSRNKYPIGQEREPGNEVDAPWVQSQLPIGHSSEFQKPSLSNWG